MGVWSAYSPGTGYSAVGGREDWRDDAAAIQREKMKGELPLAYAKLGLERRGLDLGNELQRQGLAQQGSLARQGFATQLEAQRIPLRFAQQRFNTVFPKINSALQGLGNRGSAQAQYQAVGGQSGPSPHISAGPVWTEQAMQNQINSRRALTDQATQGQIANMQESMAGQGFGGNSPGAALLEATMRGQGLANNAQMETGLRWNAAEGNAGQLFRSQMGQSQQFADRMQEDIERRRLQQSAYQADESRNQQERTSLLAMLAGLA